MSVFESNTKKKQKEKNPTAESVEETKGLTARIKSLVGKSTTTVNDPMESASTGRRTPTRRTSEEISVVRGGEDSDDENDPKDKGKNPETYSGGAGLGYGTGTVGGPPTSIFGGGDTPRGGSPAPGGSTTTPFRTNPTTENPFRPPPPPPLFGGPPPQAGTAPIQVPEEKYKKPKPINPTPFEGDRTKWVTFVIQALVFFSHYPEYFKEEGAKCTYFLGWMQGDIVGPWAESILVTMGDKKEHEYLTDFDKLITGAATLWGPVNQEENAQKEIDRIKQESSISKYHAKFMAHAAKSGYNEKALVRAFYKGLKESIKNLMINMEKPETLTGMLEASLNLETRILERIEERKFYEQSSGKNSKETNQKETSKTGRLTEEERKKLMAEGRCFICKQIGHLSKACPKKAVQTKRGTVEDDDNETSKKEDFPPA
jgi:hypothetical protein